MTGWFIVVKIAILPTKSEPNSSIDVFLHERTEAAIWRISLSKNSVLYRLYSPLTVASRLAVMAALDSEFTILSETGLKCAPKLLIPIPRTPKIVFCKSCKRRQNELVSATRCSGPEKGSLAYAASLCALTVPRF